MNSARQPNPETYHALQLALDQYFEDRKSRIEPMLRDRLGLKECFQIQKRYFLKDVARNPFNALWAIPYFSIRKVIEVSDKLGWDTGRNYLSKIPQALKTDFQKEVERMIQIELFGLASHADQVCELTQSLKSKSLQKNMSESEWNQLVSLAQNQVRQSVSEFCAKQNGFTDLAASGGILVAAELLFHDRSMDIFALGRKVAALWAKKDAVSHFAFGKTLGRAFYNVAPPPPPTTMQILITTSLGILLLALFSTAIGILSYPLQQKLGFRQKQLETLLDTVSARLQVELTKGLKKPLGDTTEGPVSSRSSALG